MRGEKRIFRRGTAARAVGKDGTGVRWLFPEGNHPPPPQPAHLHALLPLHPRGNGAEPCCLLLGLADGPSP